MGKIGENIPAAVSLGVKMTFGVSTICFAGIFLSSLCTTVFPLLIAPGKECDGRTQEQRAPPPVSLLKNTGSITYPSLPSKTFLSVDKRVKIED